MSLLWAIVALVLLLATIGLQLDRAIQRRKRIANAIAKIPGPEESAAPFFANLRTLLLSEWAARQGRFDKAVLIYQKVQGDCMLYRNEGVFKHWIIDRPIVVALAAEFVESILSAPKQTNKSMMYFAFKSWLGEGLVTSNGSKWHSRRRVITPAFHSNILNDFLPSFDAPATRLINRLNDVKYTQPFEAGPIIAACTMDIFCETALGLGSDFQSNDTSNWAHAVHEVTRLAVVRMLNPLLWLDRLFYMSETGKQFAKSRDYMQNIAMKVILERRTEWVARLKSTDSGGSDWTDAWNQFGASGADNESQRQPGTPKRPRVKLAFLDMMLYQHLVEKNLSLKDVKEEVDTFMFAGQDTTAVTIGWALYMLGLNQTIQDKVRCEVNEIMQDQDEEYEEGEDEDEERDESAGARINGRLKLTNMTPEALTRLRYLEMVIKETLRYWPTVPNVSRDLNEDLLLGGKYLVPAGCTVAVHLHALHHDPRWFPKPDVFDPDRFLPENSARRHPFAYVPFSAGPRNCIGQRFAMMEVKVVLAKILRNYKVVTTTQLDKLRIVSEVVLKAENGPRIRLEPLHAD